MATASMTPSEQLQARLSDPRTVEALNRLLDRIELAAFSLEALDGFVRRADVIANSIADSVSEIREASAGQGANLLEKLPQLASTGAQLADLAQKPEFTNLLSLVDKAGKPETVEKLNALLERLDLAVFGLNALDGFLRRSPEFTDALAQGAAELRQIALALDAEKFQQLMRDMGKLLDAGQKLAASGLLDKLDELANTGLMLSDAGMFEPQVVSTLGTVGRMASESYNEALKAPAKRLGLLGFLRAMNDPEAQRTLGVLAEAARRFGAKIK
jgi:uncharacterized protein YjgD (DUF1641 family)